MMEIVALLIVRLQKTNFIIFFETLGLCIVKHYINRLNVYFLKTHVDVVLYVLCFRVVKSYPKLPFLYDILRV